LQFAKNVRNLAGKKMPPLYPSVPGSTQAIEMKSSTLLSASDKLDEQGRIHATLNFNTALAAETQALTTAQSVIEGAAASLRSRGGTVSPHSR